MEQSTPEKHGKVILIDVREEFELLEKLVYSEIHPVINIPSRHIKFSKEGIDMLSKEYTVLVMCRSSGRSNKIKQTFFEHNENVISVTGGLNSSEAQAFLEEQGFSVQIKNGGLGFQQVMQLIFAAMLVFILGLVWFKVDQLYILAIITLLINAILFQVFTKSCVLSKIYPPV